MDWSTDHSNLSEPPSRPSPGLPVQETSPQASIRSSERQGAFIVMPNDQLTDGGPPLAPESPERIAGPPFGGAPGSAFL